MIDANQIGGRWNLTTLLCPEDESSFFAETIGKRPLHVAGDGDKFSELLSWHTVNRILSTRALTFPHLKLSKGQQEIRADTFYSIDASGIRRPRLRDVNALIGTGATLTVECISQLHEPLSLLARSVESRLRVPVDVALDMTCCSNATTGMRWKDHDSLVMHVAGKKQWAIYGMTRRFPTALDAPAEPVGSPQWVGLLDSGDLMYLPRGWWHIVTATSEPSLTITIKFRIPTGLDIATGLLNHLNGLEFMRLDYPLFADAEVQSQYLTRIQSEIVRQSREPGLIHEFFHDMWSSAPAQTEFSFPWAALTSPSKLPDDCVVILLARFPFRAPVYEGESAEVIYGGGPLLVDDQVAYIWEYLWTTPMPTVRSLVEGCRETISPDRVSELLSLLLKAGLVALRPDQCER